MKNSIVSSAFMQTTDNRTKIVATLGPASNSREIIKQLVIAGMNVARLNFSHGRYQDYVRIIEEIRSLEAELDTPITILQDLQGPKIRVGQLPKEGINLEKGKTITLVPQAENDEESSEAISIDYPYLAQEATLGTQILLDDGRLELMVEDVTENALKCRVIVGGILTSRKGVNLPDLDLRLPSLTEKDKEDLDFGITQGVDWISLSFVRRPEDVRALKQILREKDAEIPVIAKIEKPQAITHLDAIVAECDGLMVARGDLGVEMKPEKVPMLQKKIIQTCNRKGIPVITATQMLESMINASSPTRAEASDVANAIIDGTDAIMLSGESAVGKYPVRAVEMMVRIATEVEKQIEFVNHPPAETDETHALSEALNTIDKILSLQCIACFTTTGYTARLAAGERSQAPVIAFTSDRQVYHALNLIWGVKPLLLEQPALEVEKLIAQIEASLLERNLAAPGDKILILGGSPVRKAMGTNFLKIHSISET
ncbi:MAG: pyruvate kinase [Oscillatoria sp. PMC 1051.18]|nr:pyruvate kinase [Oscillatoria sp. PMC 1050.18]MEC5030685.1 pyruvate kinase [Oscillatoria sp. PMC 1051.18]